MANPSESLKNPLPLGLFLLYNVAEIARAQDLDRRSEPRAGVNLWRFRLCTARVSNELEPNSAAAKFLTQSIVAWLPVPVR